MQWQYRRRFIILTSVLVGVFFFPLAAFAQSSATTDALQMLINLSRTYGAIWRMVTGACYVIGFALAITGIYYLKQYGELRTMMSTQTSLKVPVILFIVSGVLIYIPQAFATLNRTLLGSSSPINWGVSSTNHVVVDAIAGLVELVGLISFVRGWMILVAHAKQPGGHATLGRALTHIIGGLLALNIVGVANILATTLGLAKPFPG